MSDLTPRLKTTRNDGIVVVELADRKILDEAVIGEIAEQLYALVAEADVPKLVLDFQNVSHMSSGALGMLITLHKRIRERNGALRLCNISESIYEVFVITRLNEVFKVSDSLDAAVSDLS